MAQAVAEPLLRSAVPGPARAVKAGWHIWHDTGAVVASQDPTVTVGDRECLSGGVGKLEVDLANSTYF